ncbi:hypothetical protein KM043_001719 [Ampulex compressa]|nr:hypothetical protein KM043_001719 [Ampulex compressa]
MNIGKVVDFSNLDQDIQDILSEAATFRQRSYSPYSNFKVGASLLCMDGMSFGACNVENAAYPVGICAERSALAKAISEGKKKFRAMAVVADQEGVAFTSPCVTYCHSHLIYNNKRQPKCRGRFEITR